jgi:small GTP-binding protein
MIVLDGKPILLDILDSAGPEDFCSLRNQWISHYEGFMLVYSVTYRPSFEQLQVFMDEIRSVLHVEYVPLVVCANKVDLVETREVSMEEGQALARKLGAAEYFETSAKSRTNIDEAYFSLARAVLNPPMVRFQFVQPIALLVCLAQRFDSASPFSRLPRDVAVMIARWVLRSYSDLTVWKPAMDSLKAKPNQSKKCYLQ